jgi:nitrate/TMAO reductase-like tetraheme cytochrome c subunit
MGRRISSGPSFRDAWNARRGILRRCRGIGRWKSARNVYGGIGESVGPAFSYVPGQPLENYIRLQHPDANAAVDVHGNQVALTQRSRCYQNSQMSCTSCHDVHAPERAAAAYSEKCLKCHNGSDCGEFAKLGARIRDNCIDCHMPVQESNLIISKVNGKQIKARMRNHWIRVYAAPGNCAGSRFEMRE